MKTNVATFEQPVEAEELTSYLNGHGVKASIQDERRLQRFWFWTKPRAGIHVLVQADQFPAAHRLLEETTGQPLLQKAVHCPACGSPRVDYPDMTRKNFIPALTAQFLSLFGIAMREFYCEDCHHTWQPPG